MIPPTEHFPRPAAWRRRCAHYAATLLCDLSSPPCRPDKRVHVTGGLDINGNPLMSAELNDRAPEIFSGNREHRNSCTPANTATLLKTGKVLIIGWGPATAELFDPVHRNLQSDGQHAGGPRLAYGDAPDERKSARDGGISGAPPTTTVLSEAELYDPTTGSFSATLGPMANARQWHTASSLANGKVLVAGGMLDNADTATATAELFIRHTNVHGHKGPDGGRARLPYSHCTPGRYGFETGGDDGAATLASARVYDPTAELFRRPAVWEVRANHIRQRC